MSEHNRHKDPSYSHTSTRRHGKRMSKKERLQVQDTFIKAYALNGNIMLSCRRANVNRSTFYQWLEHDTEFSVRYHTAEKDFADLALAEFRKRAMEGYEELIISRGEVLYDENGKPRTKRIVSDTLLAMLIKRHFPEYREKAPTTNITILPKEYVNIGADEDGVDP